MSRISLLCAIATLLLAGGCASLPTGPSVMVLPGTGMSFDQFRVDDANCQQFALAQIGGGTPNDQAINSGVASAAVGTVVGAAAGAAIGGGATGAAIGAGSGLLGGSMVGASSASSSRYVTQQHYDVAYIQCMYAKGHQVPVSGQFSNVGPRPAATSAPAAAPPANIPPPPPGSPPPPPPQ